MAAKLATTFFPLSRAPKYLQDEDSPAFTATGARILIRPWHKRRDRGQQARWPRSTNPFAALWSIQACAAAELVGDITGTRLSWAIQDVHSSETIGRISLRDMVLGSQQGRMSHGGSARLGIHLAEPYTGRGLGSDALRLFFHICFIELGFGNLILDVAGANLRARRCYHNLGFTEIANEWRELPGDPALDLVDTSEYLHLNGFYKCEAGVWFGQFFESELPRVAWMTRLACVSSN